MAYSQSGNIITQSVTDSAIPATTPGVNGVSLGTANLLIFGANMLRINGDLTLNGFLNTLFFDNESDTAPNTNERNHDIEVNGSLTIDVSSVSAGETVYSNKTIYLSRRPSPAGGGGAHVLNTSGASFAVLSGGLANLKGGYYEVSHNFAVATGGEMNAEGVHFKTDSPGKRFWMDRGSSTSFVNCTIENFAPYFNEFPSAVENVTFVNCGAITKEKAWTNGLEATPSIILSPNWSATDNSIMQIWAGAWLRVRNSVGGSALGIANNPGANAIIYGVCDFTQEVRFNILDTAGQPVDEAKLSAIESENGDRKNEVSNVGAGTRYDDTDVREMNWLSDAAGVTNTIEARLLSGSRPRNGSNNYSEARFSNTSADEYDVSGYRYGYNFFTKRYQFRSAGVLEVSEVFLQDFSITETVPALVDLYPFEVAFENESYVISSVDDAIQQVTAAQLYDKVALYLDQNFARVDLRVSREGETVDCGARVVTLDKIEFIGSLTGFFVSLNNGSSVSGIRSDNNGRVVKLKTNAPEFGFYGTRNDAPLGAYEFGLMSKELTLQPGDVLRACLVAHGYAVKFVELNYDSDFFIILERNEVIDLSLVTNKQTIATALHSEYEADGSLSIIVDSDLKQFTPAEVLTGFDFWLYQNAENLAPAVVGLQNDMLYEYARGRIVNNSPAFSIRLDNAISENLPGGYYFPLVVESSGAFASVKPNANGILLGTALWTQQAAEIGEGDVSRISDRVETGPLAARTILINRNNPQRNE